MNHFYLISLSDQIAKYTLNSLHNEPTIQDRQFGNLIYIRIAVMSNSHNSYRILFVSCDMGLMFHILENKKCQT